jgi:hypothetical protein
MDTDKSFGIEGAMVVEGDGVSRFGLHRLHLVRWGEVGVREVEAAVELAGRLARGRGCVAEVSAVVRYEEAGAGGLWHLRLYWWELVLSTDEHR